MLPRVRTAVGNARQTMAFGSLDDKLAARLACRPLVSGPVLPPTLDTDKEDDR